MTAAELVSRGQDYLLARSLERALTALEEAMRSGADPDECAGALWQVHMLRGDFAAAWQQSDTLRDRNAPDPHRFWQREEIAGKRVIVRCLHGFGDAVQMLRYAPLLREQAASVVWEVAPKMVPLARCFTGVDEVITWGEQAPAEPTQWDVQVEVMELPYLFRTTTDDLPIAQRYLTVPPSEKMPGKTRRRAGIVWSAADWNPSRSMPFDIMQPLLDDDRWEFWSLQTSSPQDPRLVHQLSITGEGLLALAQAIAGLDLVISVDTLAAHMAGALGKPCWLLLQYAADWRWLHERNDSPWYPSMRIFRQPAPGDWNSVVDVVQQQLATFDL